MKQTFTPVIDGEGYIDKTNKLYEKISQVSKNISYLDIYNIVDVVTDKNTLSAKISALTPNSSLVINTDPFYLNLDFYNTGDIILKNTTGEAVHISAQPGGIYFPVKIEQIEGGTTYQISYKYSQSKPDVGSSAAVNTSQEVPKPAETISFNNIKAQDVESSYVYGIWQSMNQTDVSTLTANFPIYRFTIENNEEIIQPQIQFWLVDDNKNPKEQLFVDFDLLNEGTQWKITIVSPGLSLDYNIEQQLAQYDSYEELSTEWGQGRTQDLLSALGEFGIKRTTPYGTWFDIIKEGWGSMTNEQRYQVCKCFDYTPSVFIKVK